MTIPSDKKQPDPRQESGQFQFSPKQGKTPAPGIPLGAGESRLNFDTDLENLAGRESGDAHGELDEEGRERRLPCNFPGIMKILVPERSFTPVAVPVRVVNLSATGAMIEVHDCSKLNDESALANRYFELKVAHPEIPVIRGTIAWSDVKRQNPLLGLSSFDVLSEFSRIILADDSTAGFKGPPPLPPPKLHAYPPRTRESIVTLIGEAPEAIEVVAKGGTKKYSAPVQSGRFELRVELEPNKENHFSVRAFAGERKSRALPVRIINEQAPSPPRDKAFNVKMRNDEQGNVLLEVQFCGNVQQAERILYRFSQLMASAERIAFVAELESPVNFDKRLLETLRNEGMLIAADTTRSRFASKLLNEMF